MKIAYIYPEELPSQMARSVSVVNSVAGLSRLAEVTLIFEKTLQEGDLEGYYGVDLSRVKLTPISKKLFGFRSNLFFNYRTKRALDGFDIFYVRHLKTAKYLIENKKPFQKVIFEAHEIFHEQNPKTKELESFVCEMADGIVFINQTLQSAFESSFERLAPYKTVAYLGANTINSQNGEKNFENVQEIYYVGSLQKWKGVETAIEAVGMSKDAILVVVGGKDEQIIELKALAESLEVSQRIRFIGQVSANKAANIIQNEAKVVILPNINSPYDRFTSPLKLFEYMSGRNAIIASDIPTIRELTDDGECAELFMPANTKELALKIDELLANPTKMRALADKAYMKSKEFGWDTRALKLEQFFVEVWNK